MTSTDHRSLRGGAMPTDRAPFGVGVDIGTPGSLRDSVLDEVLAEVNAL